MPLSITVYERLQHRRQQSSWRIMARPSSLISKPHSMGAPGCRLASVSLDSLGN